MGLDAENLVSAMSQAGRGLGGALWGQMNTYAVPEFRKIAVQIAAIAEHIGDYSPDGAKALMKMQIDATIGVIVAMTTLTLLDVQTAINQILAAISGEVNRVIGFALL